MGGDSCAGGPLRGLRCGAQPWGVSRELAARLCQTLRSNSRDKSDVEVRLSAHRPTACAPRHRQRRLPPRPNRHTTWTGGWGCGV